MQKTGILCNAILVIFLANMAVSMVIKPEAKHANEPVIQSFGLGENSIAYIGSNINLTCKMENTEVGIFLNSGVPVQEGGRFRYIFEEFGDGGLLGILEITNVAKEDEGIYTCYAYNAGRLALKAFTLRTGSTMSTLKRKEDQPV